LQSSEASSLVGKSDEELDRAQHLPSAAAAIATSPHSESESHAATRPAPTGSSHYASTPNPAALGHLGLSTSLKSSATSPAIRDG
jgi:hypothetical protein